MNSCLLLDLMALRYRNRTFQLRTRSILFYSLVLYIPHLLWLLPISQNFIMYWGDVPFYIFSYLVIVDIISKHIWYRCKEFAYLWLVTISRSSILVLISVLLFLYFSILTNVFLILNISMEIENLKRMFI